MTFHTSHSAIHTANLLKQDETKVHCKRVCFVSYRIEYLEILKIIAHCTTRRFCNSLYWVLIFAAPLFTRSIITSLKYGIHRYTAVISIPVYRFYNSIPLIPVYRFYRFIPIKLKLCQISRFCVNKSVKYFHTGGNSRFQRLELKVANNNIASSYNKLNKHQGNRKKILF